jgi:predicted glycoside hydrolase/deacetylase ChbG (UPF0249 family)
MGASQPTGAFFGAIDSMSQALSSQTNRLLGHPADARLLIVNADDFGMCHSVNAAIMDTLQEGIVCSTSLMAPCPWALQAMRFLANHPQISFGIHLTVIAEWANYRWGPLASRANVPSLVDDGGYFYNFEDMPRLLAQVKLNELEVEFRTQIEFVLGAELKPSHLDWHALRIAGRGDIFELMLRLAQEYGLALRVAERSWQKKLQSQGLPTNNYHFLDSYILDPANKAAQYTQLLQELPVGLSEWAVHPGLDNAELIAIDPGGSRIRQADFDFFASQQAKEIIEEEGIILLDYRALQKVWREE